MTERSSRSGQDGVSRRTVLRRTAIGGGAVVVGTASFSTLASATVCPRTPGYWKTHEWPDLSSPDDGTEDVPDTLATIFGFATPEEGRTFLAQPARGNKWQIISEQFVATVLNFQFRGDGGGTVNDPDCVDQVVFVDGIGYTTVRAVKRAAQRWIRMPLAENVSVVRDWDAYVATVSTFSQGSTPDYDDPTGSTTVGGEVLKDALDAFNNGTISGLDCDCDGGDDPPTDPIRGGGGGGPGGKGKGGGNGGAGGPP